MTCAPLALMLSSGGCSNVKSKPAWLRYQALAAELLNRFAKDFGLSHVENTQSIPGVLSGTSWAIDAKGVLDGSDGIVLVECRRYSNKKQTQEQMAALAYLSVWRSPLQLRMDVTQL